MFLQKLVDYGDPKSFANRFRRKRSAQITSLVSEIHVKYGCCRILDLGGTFSYWEIFPRDWLEKFNVTITLLNLQAIPRPALDDRRFESVIGSACELAGYANNEFHLVHSN